jgi:general secretion pathway protein I
MTGRSKTVRATGFTIVEVMIALAILAVGLTILVKSSASSMRTASHSQLMGVATDLSRGKMLDIEEVLLKDGFTETSEEVGECGDRPAKQRVGAALRGAFEPPVTGEEVVREDNLNDEELRSRRGKPFEDEGWPNIYFAYKVESVELPSYEELQQLTQQRNAGSGSGSDGSDGGFGDTALGGMLSMLGGGGGGSGAGSGSDAAALEGGAFIQGFYPMIQQILKDSIRKVSLCVTYEVMGSPQVIRTVAYFVDPTAMDKVLGGRGAQELPGAGSGGSGAGSGSSSTPRNPRNPRNPRGGDR